jgi:hypothetical protein
VRARLKRYDTIAGRLSGAEGRITPLAAMALLGDVSQGNTQWSVVYEMGNGDVEVTVDRAYDRVHTFHLDLAGQ